MNHGLMRGDFVTQVRSAFDRQAAPPGRLEPGALAAAMQGMRCLMHVKEMALSGCRRHREEGLRAKIARVPLRDGRSRWQR